MGRSGHKGKTITAHRTGGCARATLAAGYTTVRYGPPHPEIVDLLSFSVTLEQKAQMMLTLPCANASPHRWNSSMARDTSLLIVQWRRLVVTAPVDSIEHGTDILHGKGASTYPFSKLPSTVAAYTDPDSKITRGRQFLIWEVFEFPAEWDILDSDPCSLRMARWGGSGERQNRIPCGSGSPSGFNPRQPNITSGGDTGVFPHGNNAR